MPKYLTKEVENEYPINTFKGETKRELIAFISHLRLADKQALYSEINEWVEKNKVLEVSLPSDDARVLLWKQKHNKTLSDLIEFIKSKKE